MRVLQPGDVFLSAGVDGDSRLYLVESDGSVSQRTADWVWSQATDTDIASAGFWEMSLQEDGDAPRFRCDVCGWSFTSTEALNTHPHPWVPRPPDESLNG